MRPGRPAPTIGPGTAAAEVPCDRQRSRCKRDPFHDRHPSQQTAAAATLTPLWMWRQPKSICETWPIPPARCPGGWASACKSGPTKLATPQTAAWPWVCAGVASSWNYRPIGLHGPDSSHLVYAFRVAFFGRPKAVAAICALMSTRPVTDCSGTTAASGTPWPMSAAVASAIVWHGCFDAWHHAFRLDGRWRGGHFARVRSHDRVRRDRRRSRSETARALEGMLRRFSSAVATSREGHCSPRSGRAVRHLRLDRAPQMRRYSTRKSLCRRWRPVG